MRGFSGWVVAVALLLACSTENDDGGDHGDASMTGGRSAGGGGGFANGGEDASSDGGGTGGATGSSGSGGTATGSGGTGTGGSMASGGAGNGYDGGPQGGIDAPAPNRSCTLVWESGFEDGFPGEFGAYDNGSWSPSGTLPDGRVSAWTIVDAASGDPVLAGDHAYKGWITASAAESHRAYPGIYQDTYPTPLVNTFWVYLDVDYDQLGGDWVHFGTWGNDDGAGNGQWALHTMSVRDRKLEFAHTEPFLGEYIGPAPAPDFPLRRWVRFTVYVLYEGTTGFVQAWQDGLPMLRAQVSQLATYPGDSLITAHWGMYAAAGVDHGTQYNDEIRLWTLDAPLTDLDVEPLCGE